MGIPVSALLLFLACACSRPPAASGKPRNPGQTDTCDPHPTGLPGSFVVKFDAGFNYQPEGGHIQPRILDDFLTPFLGELVGSSVRLTRTESMQADMHILVSVMNDGSDNFQVLVNASGAGTPSPGLLFSYRQQRSYTSAVHALEDAADTVAGFLKNGWTCEGT